MSRSRREVAPRCESSSRQRDCFVPVCPPGELTAEAKLPKPLALDVKSRLVFSERLLKVDAAAAGKTGGEAPRLKALRWVRQAASAINGEVRATAGVLRPELSLLVAERIADGTVVVVSPAGPMTRSELELVQGLGDPLILVDLLPRRPVSKGEIVEAAELRGLRPHRV